MNQTGDKFWLKLQNEDTYKDTNGHDMLQTQTWIITIASCNAIIPLIRL